MKILALDSATQKASAALLDGEQTWQAITPAGAQHSRQLLPMVYELLDEAGSSLQDVEALAVSCGPGSFTGLRVAIGLAQGLALSLQRPLVPVSTLAALAQQAWRRYQARHVIAALDARLDELYLGAFMCDEHALPQPLLEPQLGRCLPTLPEQAWYGIGNAWALADADKRMEAAGTPAGMDAQACPEARDVARIAAAMLAQPSHTLWPATDVQPVYLRNRVAGRRDSSQSPS